MDEKFDVYLQCTCDDDVTNYKRILRQWIYSYNLEHLPSHRGTDDSEWPPCSHRYLAMADVERDITTEPSGNIGIVLRPETDFDAHETTLWLNDLLHRIYREVHSVDLLSWVM